MKAIYSDTTADPINREPRVLRYAGVSPAMEGVVRSVPDWESDPAARQTLRCITINTHRGQGPKLPYLLSQASMQEAERIELLHQTRAYTYYMAEWLHLRRDCFDVVGLQEVFTGTLSLGERLLRKFRQRDHYRVISGFRSAISHGVGFAAFRYENLLLSQLASLDEGRINYLLPGRVYMLAACGFTLAPFLFQERLIWVGNTHLHAYNPKKRAEQAKSIAREIRKLGDVPVIFLGDFNTVAPGCRDSGFEAGERDRNSYKNDRTFEIVFDAGLQTVQHQDSEEFYTYPTGLPNRTLDYIFFSRHWETRAYGVVKEFKFSDHYPVFAEFRLKS